MPGVVGYSSDVTSDLWKAAEESGSVERKARAETIQNAWAYYDGQHKPHLKTDYTQTDDNVIINKVRELIDKSVAGLLGSDDAGLLRGLTFDVADQAGESGFLGGLFRRGDRQAQKSPAQQYLDDLWELNKRAQLQYGVAMNGSIAGHCFVRLVPQGLYAWWKGGDAATRLINLDPAMVTVFWDVSDVERVLWYRLDYGVGETQRREDIVRAVNEAGDDVGRWQIYQYRKAKLGAPWASVGDRVEWSYPWAPIVDWPNIPRPNAFYGLSDVGLAGKLNDSLNFAIGNTQRIFKYHAQQLGVAFGVTIDELAKAVKADTNDILAIPNAEARLEWRRPIDDLKPGMDLIATLNRAIFDTGREMDSGAVQDRLGDLTNFGLHVLFKDVLAKNGTKRLVYGEQGYTAINRRLLHLGNYDPATLVNNVWPDPLPVNETEEAQALDIDRRNGVSQYSYLKRRNYDPDQEEIRRGLEQQDEREATTDQFLRAVQSGGFGARTPGRPI